MRFPQQVIRQPLVTEKTTILRESKGVYCFRVNRDANKIEIAHAIEQLFDKVKVKEVRTSRVRGKIKRLGRFLGQRPAWKKAWVKLAADSKEIEFFEAT
jgi:large subunit ribosomal protein L23